jgi:hypothetical protein
MKYGVIPIVVSALPRWLGVLYAAPTQLLSTDGRSLDASPRPRYACLAPRMRHQVNTRSTCRLCIKYECGVTPVIRTCRGQASERRRDGRLTTGGCGLMQDAATMMSVADPRDYGKVRLWGAMG